MASVVATIVGASVRLWRSRLCQAMANVIATIFGAPIKLWRSRLWWIYAVLAFLAVPAVTAVLVKTPPIVPTFAYTLK